jgi:phospholipase/lecithinase/hemolysin
MLRRWNTVVFSGILMFSAGGSNAQTRSWETLYTFGDSYTDSGAGYIDGNGPTAVVYLAEALGVPFTYVGDPNSAGKGLNFAVSGAQTGKSDGVRIRPAVAECGSSDEALLDRGMQTQVTDFAQRVHSGALHFDPEKTLFFVAGGLNDANLQTALSITNLEGEVRTLYELGGRYVMIAVMPTRLSPDSKPYRKLNTAILMIPHHLEAALPGSHIVVSKWGEYYDEVFKNPSKYGITNTTDRCAGRALFSEDPTPCQKPDSYFYYHEGHPSTAVHRIVAREMEREITSAFPLKKGAS